MSRTLTEADYATLAAMAAAGARLEDAAARLNTSRRSLSRLFESDERARQAWSVGRSELHQKLIGKLIEKALAGEVVPLLFALKTVYGYVEGQVLDGDEQRSLVTINLPAALAPEAYEKLIEVDPRRVALTAGAVGA